MCANVTVLNVFHVDIFIKTQAETKKLHRRGDTWHCINYWLPYHAAGIFLWAYDWKLILFANISHYRVRLFNSKFVGWHACDDDQNMSQYSVIFHPIFSFFCIFFIEAEKRPLKKIVANAGTNVTLACDALNEKSVLKIEKLTWKSSKTIIAKYNIVDAKPTDKQQQKPPQQEKNERVSAI